MARGAIEKCCKNKILSIFKTSLQNSQTFIAFIFPFLPQLQVHLEKPSAQECDLKNTKSFVNLPNCENMIIHIGVFKPFLKSTLIEGFDF